MSAICWQRRVDSVQSESRDLESENSKLHKTVESLRHSLRRLNDLEKENTDLESENHRLDRESKGLHKEIVRLKQAIEVRISPQWIHVYLARYEKCVERGWRGVFGRVLLVACRFTWFHSALDSFYYSLSWKALKALVVILPGHEITVHRTAL